MNETDSYRQSSDEVIEKLGSNAKTGLSSDEAAKRLEKYGPNEIQKGEHTSLLQKFIAQFKDFMIIVLLVAAIVSWLVSGDLADAFVILIDRKSTRLNSSHVSISYAVFCLKKKSTY